LRIDTTIVVAMHLVRLLCVRIVGAVAGARLPALVSPGEAR
jgi:hypothetical protein